MSLWAAIHYHFTFTSLSLQVPASLTLWHHAYTLNALLMIQETADTFGLLCLGLLFVYAQLLSRNSMLSIFTLFESSPETTSNASANPFMVSNKTKVLVKNSTTFSFITKLCISPLYKIKSRFSSKTEN